MARPARDTITISKEGGGDASLLIDRSTQFEIVTDLLAPSTARFELGDEGTWDALRDIGAIGSRMVVSINGYTRLKGRLLTRNLMATVGGGATVQLAIRTRLADAMFTACDPGVGVKNVQLKDLILQAFKRMGLEEADFIFQGDVARSVLTGRGSRNAPEPAVHTLREDEARPHPPETIYAFVDRHLSRFGLMMWDAPDGRIIIDRPDVDQRAIYSMTARRGAQNSRTNNLLSATKTEDFEDVPRDLWVFGVGGGRDINRATVKFVQFDSTLFSVDPRLSFSARTAVIVDESLKTQAQAEARARREMMRRSLQKDTWMLETDGFSYWSGTEAFPYVINTIGNVQVDVAGGASGPYLFYNVTMRGNAHDGMTTCITGAGREVWRL
jgi:hypothetical protein